MNYKPHFLWLHALGFASILCAPFCIEAKTENSARIEKATKLLQEAMILLKEAESGIDEHEILDPANYQKAIEYLKEGKHDLAKQIFAVFTKTEGERAVHAVYYLGMCFLEEKNYEKAMLTFVSFLSKIDNFDISGINSDMRKMANKYLVRCFERLQRPIDACAIVTRIEKEYPNECEEYVKNARDYLKCDRIMKRDSKN